MTVAQQQFKPVRSPTSSLTTRKDRCLVILENGPARIGSQLLDDMMFGPIEMMRLTVDGMMERGFGRIVNIVSRSVKIPQVELGVSKGARSGLVGWPELTNSDVHLVVGGVPQTLLSAFQPTQFPSGPL